MFRLIGGLFKLTVKMGVLAAGIGAIIAYANLSDVESWKEDLQERVSQVSGRKLSFDGPIDFKISFPPRIIVQGVRIENAKWGSKRDMLKAEALIADVDFLPLLFGSVLGSGGIGVSGGTVTISNLVSGAINTITLPGAVFNVGSGLSGFPCL